ncbi:hypothetical protein J1N35_012242 [Gossypium stocksii]|uniref:Uncharacterized protein n=1 Tax=Gossypium stocksii TaxID=47602 RepID=A0A9D3W3J2_9ROSI|nr:hypothetical protein J1N35_012242 [Gossypium stocksii]
MATQEVRFEQQQAFQYELLKQNDELRIKMHSDDTGFQDNVNMQNEVLGIQKEYESLQYYVKRFHKTTFNMKNLKNQWAIDAFIMDRCTFHDDMRHKIDDCFTLKEHIDEVVQNDELTEFMNQSNLQQVQGFKVKRILIDSGSAVEVLSWDAYQKMRLKEKMLSKANPLYNFVNHLIEVKGTITLLVTLRDGEHTTIEYV